MPRPAMLRPGGTQRLRNRRAYAIPTAATYSMYLNKWMMDEVDTLGATMTKSRSEIVEAFIKLGLKTLATGSKEERREIFE